MYNLSIHVSWGVFNCTLQHNGHEHIHDSITYNNTVCLLLMTVDVCVLVHGGNDL